MENKEIFRDIISKYGLNEKKIEFLFFCLKSEGTKLVLNSLIAGILEKRDRDSDSFEMEKEILDSPIGTILITRKNNEIIVVCGFAERYKWTRPAFSDLYTWEMSLKSFILCCIDIILCYYEKNNFVMNAKEDEEYEELSLEDRYYKNYIPDNLIELDMEEYYLNEIDVNKFILPVNIRNEVIRLLYALDDNYKSIKKEHFKD